MILAILRSLHVTLCDMDIINLAMTCVDSTMMTPIDDARYYRRKKRHQHAVVNKKSMIIHTLAVVVFMCAEKSGSGEKGRHKSLR